MYIKDEKERKKAVLLNLTNLLQIYKPNFKRFEVDESFEVVKAIFATGTIDAVYTINIAMDSADAMVMDIMKVIGYK